MVCEDLLVVLSCLQSLTIERSKETLTVWQGVGGPLSFCWGEECVVAGNFGFVMLGNWRQFLRSGRATAWGEGKQQSREYDATRGYPDEDI